MTGTQAPTLLDLFSAPWADDPYGMYRHLRERTPVFWDEIMHSWVVLGYDDIVRLGKDDRLSGARIVSFSESLPADVRAEMAPLTGVLSDMMLFNEPPRHTRLRQLVKPGMTPRYVREMRPFIATVADELLDRVAGTGRMDVIHDFSEPLTRAVIGRMTGVPPHAMPLLESWQGLLPEYFSQSRAEIPRVEKLRCVFAEGAQARRSGTGHDVFSRMISEQLQRVDADDEEIFANFLLLIDAGQATTTHLIGNAVLALIQQPDQLQLLRERPELATGAAQELMRFDSSVQFTTREATTDIEVGGQRIRAGQSVTLVLGSGNRDPRHYPDPDRIDITRKASDHLSLGHGIHYCLGASLALAEIEIALVKLLSRTAELRLAAPRQDWLESINFRFLKRLPVRFEPAPTHA
jgi:pimeloyl-[acyl-carrier protein] synthase